MTDAATIPDPDFGEPDDEFAWWRKALANPRLIGTAELPIRETEPQCGFYRVRYRQGDYRRVAIYLHDGRVVAERDGRLVDEHDVGELWIWCARFPITWEVFDQVTQTGHWPDDPPDAPGIGDNINVADPHDALMIEFLGEEELANEFLSKPIGNKDDADRVANWKKKIIAIGKRAEAFHTAEAAPAVEEKRRVDDRWQSLRSRPVDLAARLTRHAKAWFDEQDRLERIRVEAAKREADRKRREAEAAAAEADRKRREAEERARRLAEQASRETDARLRAATEQQIEATRRESDAQLAAAGKLVSEARQAESDAVYRRPQAGKVGSKMSQRTFTSGRITDYDVFLLAAKDQEVIREAAETVCNRLAKAGMALAGMEIVKEQRVV